MGERQQIRIKMEGMTVYIVDRVGLCSGTLENMSCFGLCVSGIPRPIQANNGRIDAVVFGRGYNFKLHLQCRWEVQVGDTVTIGVAIEDIPWGWADLSMRQEILAKEPYASVSTLKQMKARKKPGRKVRLSRDW